MSRLNGLAREQIYTPDYAHELDLERPEEIVRCAWERAPTQDGLGAMLATDFNTYLPDDLLTKVDIATMAYSLEARSPLLDQELVEFATALPSRLKVRGTEKKVILRRALRGVVPDRILDAPKRGFHPPIADWLRGDLLPLSRELLLDPVARDRGHFQTERVSELLREHERGTRDHSSGIWTLMIYELWHRQFVDSDRPPLAGLDPYSRAGVA